MGGAGFLKRRATRLIVPYLIFGVLSVLVYHIVDGQAQLAANAADNYYVRLGGGGIMTSVISLVHGGGWPDGEGFRCNSVLWFLPCMFSVLCIYYWFDRIVAPMRIQVVVAFGLLIGYFFLRKYVNCSFPWGLSLVPCYLPFVIFARAMALPECLSLNGCRRRFLAAMISVLWIIWGMIVYAMPNYYRSWNSIGWYCAFLPITFAGIVLSAWTVQCGSGLCKWLRILGVSSMGIMLIHKFVILGLQLKVPFIRDALSQGGLVAIVTTCGIAFIATVASCLFSKLPFVRKIV